MSIIGEWSKIQLSFLAFFFILSCFLFDDREEIDTPPGYEGHFLISHPSEGLPIPMDTTVTITWETSENVDIPTVKLELYHEEKFVSTITPMTPNTGNYTWRPESLDDNGNSDKYRIKITCTSNAEFSTYSRYFLLHSGESGAIEVESPAAGSTVKIGDELIIKWRSTGNTGSSVRIALKKDTSVIKIISDSHTDSGVYIWPSVSSSMGAGDGYTIEISATENKSIKGNSAGFSIEPDLKRNYYVTSPGKGDTLRALDTIIVIWESELSPSTHVRISVVKGMKEVKILSLRSDNNGRLVGTVPFSLETGDSYKIRVANYLDGSLYGDSHPFTIFGFNFDPFEPDEDRNQAIELKLGASLERTAVLRDEDWFMIKADSGKTYVIKNTGPARVYKDIFKGQSTEKAAAARYSQNSYIWRPLETGTYYIRVKTGLSSEAGEYTLSYISADKTLKGAFIKPVKDAVWVAGSNYSIEWKPEEVLWTGLVFFLLYQDTSRIINMGSYHNTGRYSYTTPSSLATGDNYQIWMGPSPATNASAIFSKSERFSVSGTEPDQYEPDNSWDKARTIHADSSTETHTATTADYDWFKLSGEKGTKYVFTFGDSAYLRVRLYAEAAKTELKTTYGVASQLIFTAPEDGPYFLVVHNSVISRHNTYTIAASVRKKELWHDIFEPDNSQDQARLLVSDGKPQKHSLPKRDKDWIKLQTEPGKEYVVKLEASSSMQIGLYEGAVLKNSRTGFLNHIFIEKDAKDTFYIKCSFPPATTEINYTVMLKEYIEDSVVTFTNPTQTSVWSVNAKYKITWIADRDIFNHGVYLYLYRDSQPIQRITTLRTQNDGDENWIVPGELETDSTYRICIQDSDDPKIIGYSQKFTIESSTADF